MSTYLRRRATLLFVLCILASPAWSGEKIPKVAWKRPIGQPLENAGTKKPALDAGHIDDGFWPGAPVGGFGAGALSRTLPCEFARSHLKACVSTHPRVRAEHIASVLDT